jgi:sulfite reductase subunit B
MDTTYIPKDVRIERVINEAPDIKTFCFKYMLDYIPGQFLEVSCFGSGEAPISISSSPTEDFLKLSFKRIGRVTNGLFNLKKRDCIGLRGPFGNGFDISQLQGKDLLFIAGGIGHAPLRSLVKFILSKERNTFGRIIFLCGANCPMGLLFKKELNAWKTSKELELLLTVDNSDSSWRGDVGVVTKLLDKIQINSSKTRVIMCGPEIMMHFAVPKLLKLGINPSDIILSLERYMKCGVGKCGHCYIGDTFVCRDGPVFTYERLNSIIPAEIL